MTIEVLVRGRFLPLPNAEATAVAGNSYLVRIPAPSSIARKTRRGALPEDWDGAIFALDGIETEPGLGSSAGKDHVVVSVWIIE